MDEKHFLSKRQYISLIFLNTVVTCLRSTWSSSRTPSGSGSVEAADPRRGERETSRRERRRGGETGGALALRRMHAGHHDLLPGQV